LPLEVIALKAKLAYGYSRKRLYPILVHKTIFLFKNIKLSSVLHVIKGWGAAIQ